MCFTSTKASEAAGALRLSLLALLVQKYLALKADEPFDYACRASKLKYISTSKASKLTWRSKLMSPLITQARHRK